MWGETATYTLNSSNNGSSVTTGDVSWSISSGAITTSNSNCKLTGTITVTLPNGATLNKVSLTKSNNWGSGATVVFAAGNTTLHTFTGNGDYSLTTTKTNLTYTFTKSGASDKNAWVKTISVDYTITATKVPATITLSEAGSKSNPPGTFYVGDSYELPSTTTATCGDKTFVGWSTVTIDNSVNKPTSNFYERGASITLGANNTFYAVFAESGGTGTNTWLVTDLVNINSSDEVVVTMTIGENIYALNNSGGTSEAAAATVITSAELAGNKVPDQLKWNIAKSGDNITFYPNGSTVKWLYCNTTSNSGNNNNMRVGTGDRKVFGFDDVGVLKTVDTYTTRYICVYNTADFRGYTSKNSGVPVVPVFYKKTTTGGYQNYTTECTAPSEYTVTFNANGHGTAPSAQTVESGQKATEPTAPTATGYTFGGWYKESGCTNKFDFNTSIKADIILYAKWTAIQTTITLNANGGSGNTTSVAATYDSSTLNPSSITNPTKTGYTFGGWYSGEGGTGSLVINTSGKLQANVSGYTGANGVWKATTNKTLYAKWTPSVYTITYKDQGNATFSGTHESGNPTQHTYGTETTLKGATKTGYTFGGWYKEAICTNKVTSLGATEYTAHITLYAQWKANTYTVAFNANGGTGSMSNQSFTYGQSQSLTANAFTRTDYAFKNWNTKADGSGTNYTDKQSVSNLTATNGETVTLYAQWTPTYTITWLANGQEFHKQENAVKGTVLDVPDSELDASAYACDDKVFVGWTATSIDGSTDTEPADLFTTKNINVEAASTTYYAVFATADGSGGSAGEATTVAIGDQVVIVQVDNNTTELTGFRSDKTITDANNYGTYAAYSTTPAGSLVWTVEEGANSGTFAFKNGNYYLNLGDNDNHLNCSATKNANSSWTITESNDRAVVTNVQYDSRKIMWNQSSTRFACYNKNHGLNSSQYYYHIKFYKLNAGTTYSDYTTSCDNTKATVTYDLNGGAGATCEKVTVTKDVAFNLCSETPTKEGYTFAGWSDGTKTYAAGAEATVSDNTTFYASWKAKSITITWNLNYTGSPKAATTTYIYNGEEIEMPEDPTRTGYKFDGWYTDATDGTKVTEVGETNKPSADVTYYAHWLEQYTVTYFASGQQYLKQEYKYTSGDKLVLPEIDPSAANFACDGYLFEGWSAYQQTKEDANCPELVNENTIVNNELDLHAVWKKATVSGSGTQIFYESFDTENGTGGNDDQWSGDIAKNEKVNTTWTFENEGGASQCIKLGSSKNKGSATTPILDQLSGDATLSFKAAAWNGNNEQTTLNLSISGGGTLTPTSVTLNKGEWTDYEVQIKDGTSSSKITFEAAYTSNNRFFLDEVTITTQGGYNYTTSPSCGPTMVAKENVWATSAKGQKVKVNVPVGVKLFTGAATITGTSTNENFVVNTLENVGNGEHNLVVVYTPIADDTKENTTITLTAKNGEEVWSTTTFTLNGRSLPSEFVVVANKGDKNYALPANMTQANVYGGLVVEVSGDEVTAAPKSHLYNARAVHSTRFADNGTALRLVGNNDACLWASNAANGTNIRNWAKLENAKTANYEWNLYTEDGDTYYISSTAVTEEGRVLRLDGTNFGMYKQGVNAFQLLPVGCTSTPMNVQTSTTRTSATISWTNAGECDVVVKQGEAVVQNLPASVSPIVVTDLAESTAYTFTLTPTENTSCGTAGSFTTTGPTIDIVEWHTGGIRIYVDKDENVNPKVIINGEREHGNVGGQVATELFFSKYYEAHAENKLLAVYNGTNQIIDLNGYVIKHGTVEIDLSLYGQTKGSIAPNEEIILVAFDDADDKSAESCAEKEEGFNTWNVLAKELLAFSGRGSVGLYKDDQLIDLIGSVYPSGELTKIGKSGSPDNCGTGEGVRLHVGGLSVNDQSSFFCHNGDNIKTKEVETNYPISTNRCLLIRKNTVTSGADAVASNKAEAGAECGDLSSTFATLCSEWSGFRIGSGSSSTQEIQDATCEGLGYVGGFDYNNYYRTMETIHTGKTLDKYDRNPNDDTYFIEFDNVSDYSCLNIQLQLTDEAGNVLTDQITQVPILVYGNKTTTNELFSAIVKDGENPDYENSKIRCATCDVVIESYATLTKAAPGTANDVNQVRDIYVYPGGKLIVPEGANDYNVNSVSLRRDQDEVAAASIQAPLNITSSSNTPVYVDIRINSENWHWMTLPYDCNIADVTWKNGSKAIYNSDWFLMYYDGEQRAATQTGGHWYVYEGTTIEAGKGYIVGITGHPTKSGVQYELRFPMAKEVLTNENENKTVDVYAWGVEDDIKATHKGWNLVGNPYLDYYLKDEVNTFGGLRLGGKYEKDDTGHWFDTGMWGGETTNLPYLVVPVNGGWESYDQVLVSETDMKPFTSYFVQVGETTENHKNGERLDVIFDASKLRNKPQSIIQRSASEVEEPVIVGVSLTNAQGESDKTSLVIDNQFTDEYEMNADFFKWFGDYYKYYTKPVLYTVGADQGKRAFNALSEDLASQPISLGMYAAQAGNYTFSLDLRSDLSKVQEVWLYDATQDTYTNLMQDSYTFQTAKTESAGRFFLSVKMAPKVSTDIDNITNGSIWATTQDHTIIVNGLLSNAQLWIYDATGKLLHTDQTQYYQHSYSVPISGTYFVRVQNTMQTQTIKVVVE